MRAARLFLVLDAALATGEALGAVVGQKTTRMRMETMAVETMVMMIFVAMYIGEMAMSPY